MAYLVRRPPYYPPHPLVLVLVLVWPRCGGGFGLVVMMVREELCDVMCD